MKQGLEVSADLPFANHEPLYYEYRDRFNRLIREDEAESAEAAALFYYLNRTGYNGLCRFNSKGQFNVPFGRYSQINYQRDFNNYRAVFTDWDFSVGDFTQISLNRRDFLYVDPPYDVEFRAYSKQGFSWDDQVRLARWLTQHPGPTVVSNQATERVIELYQAHGFRLRIIEAPRMISCTGDRSTAKEVLATRGLE